MRFFIAACVVAIFPCFALAQSADPRTEELKSLVDRAVRDGAVTHAQAASIKCKLEYGEEICTAPRANMAKSVSKGSSQKRQARARSQSRAN